MTFHQHAAVCEQGCATLDDGGLAGARGTRDVGFNLPSCEVGLDLDDIERRATGRCGWEPTMHLLVDGELAAHERAAAEDHLAGCLRCQQALDDALQLGALVRRAWSFDGPPPSRMGRALVLVALAFLWLAAVSASIERCDAATSAPPTSSRKAAR